MWQIKMNCLFLSDPCQPPLLCYTSAWPRWQRKGEMKWERIHIIFKWKCAEWTCSWLCFCRLAVLTLRSRPTWPNQLMTPMRKSTRSECVIGSFAHLTPDNNVYKFFFFLSSLSGTLAALSFVKSSSLLITQDLDRKLRSARALWCLISLFFWKPLWTRKCVHYDSLYALIFIKSRRNSCVFFSLMTDLLPWWSHPHQH